MRRTLLFVALGCGALGALSASSDARACGGFFIPPVAQGADVLTDHRMIFRITPQATTLYDEIEYQGAPQSFAWVLPIHGTVTVGLSSDIVFASLDAATMTTIESPGYSCGDCGGSSSGGSSSGGGGPPVTVLAQQTVGPYDTVQLQSSDPSALTSWLTANGYAISSNAQPIIAAYVQEGFDFLALKLSPGQGVSAMRPVRVTAAGAGLSLPLRMVAAGAGPTVGLTIWIVGDGRYEPANFPTFTISPSNLTWDFATSTSNYDAVRAQAEASHNGTAWQIESAMQIAPYQIEQPVLGDAASTDYLAIPAADGGADGGAGETADQVRQDDLTTLFPGGSQAPVWITRIRGDLSLAALASDLTLTASADQSEISNVYSVTNFSNAPYCAPCGSTGSSGGSGAGSSGSGSGGSTSSGGSGSGSPPGDIFGAPAGGGNGSNGGGCSTTTDGTSGNNAGVVVAAGLLLAAMRFRRRPGLSCARSPE